MPQDAPLISTRHSSGSHIAALNGHPPRRKLEAGHARNCSQPSESCELLGPAMWFDAGLTATPGHRLCEAQRLYDARFIDKTVLRRDPRSCWVSFSVAAVGRQSGTNP